MTKVWVPIDLPEGCYITEVQGWSNVDQCAVVLDYGTYGTEPYAEPAPQREQWEPRNNIAVLMTRRMAVAMLAELCDWDHPDAPVCALPPEAMIHAYNAMLGVGEHQSARRSHSRLAVVVPHVEPASTPQSSEDLPSDLRECLEI